MPLNARKATAEAYASAWAHRGTTVVLAVIALAVTLVVLVTAGRAAAAEQQVLAQVEATKPRLITVTILDTHPGVAGDAITRIAQLDGVVWVLALGPAVDARNSVVGAGTVIAQRELLSPLPPEVESDRVGELAPGEALVGRAAQNRLAMAFPVGSIVHDRHTTPVVGGFTSSGALDDLDRLALVAPESGSDSRATLLYVLADDAGRVQDVADAASAVIGVAQDQLQITTSDELIALGEVVAGTVGAFGRQIALGTVAAGMVLTGLAMTLALASRRRDFGRRRALGSTRSALVVLTLLEAAIPVVVGAASGTLLGIVAVLIVTGVAPPLLFSIGAFVLIVVTGTASAAIPAVLAARRDPLTILRVP